MMTYEIAEYKYACHLRDKGYVGELPYPSPKHSKMDEEGNWLLINREAINLQKYLLAEK